MDNQTAERLEMLLTYRLLLTPKDVAATCAVSLPTVYEWFRRSDFPTIKEGRKLLCTVDGLRQWLSERAANSG